MSDDTRLGLQFFTEEKILQIELSVYVRMQNVRVQCIKHKVSLCVAITHRCIAEAV
jgi:hypothetical protein